MIGFRALAAGATLCMLAGAATAEDLPPEINLQEVSVKEQHGWYVRGDAGYTFLSNRPNVSVHNSDTTTANFDSSRFDGDFSGDIGVGYQFTDLLRADITGDLFRGDFDSKLSSGSACAAGTDCSTKTSASFKAGGLMANGYVDLGTLAGFTPYIGAGLGATHVSWDDVDGTGGGSSVRYSGESGWRMTYALMAGVSYDVAANMKLDVGYRYSHIGSGDMFSSSDGTVSASSGSLQRHEIRVGLRITSW